MYLLSKNHCFVPPSNAFNIFLNTTEIIHRSFFEAAFKTMCCDIFTMEVDNSKFVKIDSMYSNFLYFSLMNKCKYLFFYYKTYILCWLLIRYSSIHICILKVLNNII